jgi:tRNA (guanine37-N1)-methyltransferase
VRKSALESRVRIDILTLFPEMLRSPLEHSILHRARQAGLLDVRLCNFREFAADRHHVVDDAPYGGGPGMVLKPEPLFRAVEALSASPSGGPGRILLMSPQGSPFSQQLARELAAEDHLAILCGRYEGFDERIREHLITDEISIGDYVLTGGELPSLVVLDAVVRLIPGVLGDAASSGADSFSEALLEHPHYTRPASFRGWPVPEVLFSGNHEEIRRWRRRESLLRTLARRPDLFRRHQLTPEDLILLGFEPPKRTRRAKRGDGDLEAEDV